MHTTMSTGHDTSNGNLLPEALSLAVHELRTPVTVVAGYLRMLLREQAGPLTTKQQKILEEADRSCGRIAALVAEMGELGKLESGHVAMAKHELDIRGLLLDLAANMHEGRDRNVRLEVHGIDQPVLVTGDRVRLAAALTALMQAALRERGAPGVVRAQCSVATDTEPGWVVLAFGDESVVGHLAAAAQRAPAFDEWRGGLGLVLPIARRVIEAHGGTLWSADGAHARGASALRLPLRR
jgi:signal transduction histidine kinase